MKRIIVLVMLLLAAAIDVMALEVEDSKFLERLGFNDSEINRILEIEAAATKEKQRVQVELNLQKAQLEKLLLEPDVDLGQVEKLLRESAEWKVRGELADIRRRVQLRSISGEDRWVKLVRAMKVVKERLSERAQEREETSPDKKVK